MDEVSSKMAEAEERVKELKELSEAKLAENYSGVELILIRDNCIDYINQLDDVKGRMED